MSKDRMSQAELSKDRMFVVEVSQAKTSRKKCDQNVLYS